LSWAQAANLLCGGPGEVIELPMNSEATTGAAGSSQSSFSSLAQKEWMSPPSDTGLRNRASTTFCNRRWRAAG
jgi:hypothetical protein